MRRISYQLAITGLCSLPLLARADTAATSAIDLTPSHDPTLPATDATDTIREGTHLVGRICRMYHTPDGQQAILKFQTSDGSTPTGPMIALPNLTLLSMESVKLGKGTLAAFRISGTVTEYKGRNYILIDDAQTTLDAPAPDAAPTPIAPAKPPSAAAALPASPAAPPAQTPPVPMTGDSSTRTMDRLLAPMPNSGQELPSVIDTPQPPSPVSASPAVAPDAPPAIIIREGTYLINRIGRLNHSSGGTQAIFTFDADGKTMGDPPVIILPNLKLANMEGAVLGRAGDLHFRVSGNVTEYKGKNFILLDKAVAIADVENQF